MRIKIGTKLTVFWLFLTIFSLVAVLLPSLLSFRNAQREAVLERQAQISSVLSEQIAHFLFLQLEALREIEFLLFPEFLENEALRNKLLQRILSRHDALVDFSLMDSEGNELIRQSRYRVIQKQELTNRSQDEEFQIAKERGYYLGPLRFEQDRPLLKVGASILDPREKVEGVIIAQIDMRFMQDVVKRISATEEPGRIYIVNKEGIVVAHPDVSLVLSQEDFSLVSPLVSDLKRSKADSTFALALATSVYRNELGQEVAGAGAPIKISLSEFAQGPQAILGTDWFVISELPTYVAFAQVRNMTIFILLIFAAILLISIVAAFSLARHIVRPIKKVHEAVQQLGQGRLDYRVDVNTKDEIGDLADGFNQMAEKLRQSLAALDEEKATLSIKVEARTRELKELTESLEGRIVERTRELQSKIDELEKFQRLTVRRELKMVELKKEIKKLKEELEKYKPRTISRL